LPGSRTFAPTRSIGWVAQFALAVETAAIQAKDFFAEVADLQRVDVARRADAG